MNNLEKIKIKEADLKKIMQPFAPKINPEENKIILNEYQSHPPSRIDVNIEKMPVFFFGTKEKKEKLERKMFESKQPYKIYDITTKEGHRKSLEIIPSSIYGLLTAFDQDVCMVVWHFLYKETAKLGYCPLELSIPLSAFPKIMGINRQGWLYKKIKESAERISNFEIFQEEYIKIKQKDGELRTYEKKSLKLFYYNTLEKKELSKGSKKIITKHYLKIEIPAWIRKNMDNLYTTSFDIYKFFSFKGGRTKKLYRLLEFIRYNKRVIISYEKLKKDLWIEQSEQFHIRQALKRSFAPLLKENYLKDIQYLEKHVVITFSNVKKPTDFKQITLDDVFYQDSFAQEIAEKLGDQKSLNFYKKTVSKVSEDIIYKCLSLTKEVEQTGKIKKSKGAIFTNLLKQECKKLNITL